MPTEFDPERGIAATLYFEGRTLAHRQLSQIEIPTG